MTEIMHILFLLLLYLFNQNFNADGNLDYLDLAGGPNIALIPPISRRPILKRRNAFREKQNPRFPLNNQAQIGGAGYSGGYSQGGIERAGSISSGGIERSDSVNSFFRQYNSMMKDVFGDRPMPPAMYLHKSGRNYYQEASPEWGKKLEFVSNVRPQQKKSRFNRLVKFLRRMPRIVRGKFGK